MYFKSSSEKSAKVYYLGEYNSGAEVDVASKFAGYAGLKNSNFLLEPSGESASGGGYSYGIYNTQKLGSTVYINAGGSRYETAKNYNASTGKLTVTCRAIVDSNSSTYCIVDGASITYTGSGNFIANGKVKVYLVDGTIDEL